MLKQVGKMSNVEIAKRLGVTEGAIRYRLKCEAEGREDGRQHKASQLGRYREIIEGWIAEQKGKRHRKTVKLLYDILHIHHHYQGSYDALRRYVRRHYPEFMKRGVKLRLETPPGELVQVDWKEDVKVQMGEWGRWVKVNVFVFILCFSRKVVLVLSDSKDLASWMRCHQEAFRKIGGLARTLRPDCLGSAVVRWRGSRSVINKGYSNYLSKLGISVFPARPGTPTDKGKVEKKIRDIFGRLDLSNRIFDNMVDIQSRCDRMIDYLERDWRCGATGLSVAESFEYEKDFLMPLPEIFPALPVKEQRCPVRRDMTVYFMGNYYQVPRVYVDKHVLCTFTGDEIIICCEGEQLGQFPYLPEAEGMVRLNQEVLMDSDIHISDTVRQWGLETARRQLSIYEDIIRRRQRCN